MRKNYPVDQFSAFMKPVPVSKSDGSIIKSDQLGERAHDVQWQYQPRIRCTDCPGKFYNTGPGQTLENFEIHLKNRKHKDMVEQRRRHG